ncbi:PleD family two-component response regulator, partial [Variovorax sp. PvP013]
GVATMAPGVAGVDALLQRADAAMYAAKAAGRDRVERWAPGLRDGRRPSQD